MTSPLPAIDYLAAPDKHPARPVCVVFGEEAFLKRCVLARLRDEVVGQDGGLSCSEFDGSSVLLRDVLAELSVVAMFGRGKRLVVVEEADGLVSRYRTELEDYVGQPKPTGVLVLEVKSWPTNTRLYKAVTARGLAIDCNPPQGASLTRWLSGWAKRMHKVELAPDAVETLVELVGPELGLLDQEVSKLALTVGPGRKVSAETVHQLVGSWRAKTAWDMLDAALDGDPSKALAALDRLLLSGEHPVAILAQISSTLRRLAAATELVLRAEAAGRRLALRDALQQSGIKQFVLGKCEQQLRRLGRQRGDRLHGWLLEADLHLKGASSLPPRTVLERLLVRLAATIDGDRSAR